MWISTPLQRRAREGRVGGAGRGERGPSKGSVILPRAHRFFPVRADRFPSQNVYLAPRSSRLASVSNPPSKNLDSPTVKRGR